jgi:glycosyltransferase involved in cell wall biosynthesis
MSHKTKVLFYTDPVALQIFGGAEIQMSKTKEHLEKINADLLIKYFNPFEDKFDDYDILHVFHTRSECLSACKLAKKKGLKVVLTPIYQQDSNRTSLFSVKRVLGIANILYSNWVDYGVRTFKNLFPFEDFLELADVVATTSVAEAQLLSKEFKIDLNKFYSVPVGVDETYKGSTSQFFSKKHNLKDFVLFVGRIEKTKNVLTLLEVFRTLDIPLVIIGHYNTFEKEYYKKCEELINNNPNVHYLGFVTPNSEELLSAYAAAKVFVLPSWSEVTSLTALEAGVAGCNVVITKNSYSQEYLQDYASYVDPNSHQDIREKIVEAWKKPRTTGLQQHILKNYTWQNTANGTFAAYKLALGLP